MNRATRLVIKTVLLGAVICGPGAARATFEATPYVGYSFEHDDNVFRYEDRNEALAQSGNSKLSDTIEEAIVGGSVDYTIGRQRLFFEGAAYERRYDEFDELDFDGNWLEEASTGRSALRSAGKSASIVVAAFGISAHSLARGDAVSRREPTAVPMQISGCLAALS